MAAILRSSGHITCCGKSLSYAFEDLIHSQEVFPDGEIKVSHYDLKKSPPAIKKKSDPGGNADDIRYPVCRLSGRTIFFSFAYLFATDGAFFSINREMSLAVRTFLG